MKRFLLFLVAISTAFVLAACTEGTSDENTGTSDESATDGEEKDSLIIGFESDAETLMANTDVNYVTDAQISNIYDRLIDRDGETGEYIPKLATEWENIDELTWRFKLQEGVKFHNGADFNAESVKYSIDFILDEENNSFYRSRWTMIEEVKVISDYEVEVVTNEPAAGLIERITTDLNIIEPGYIEEVGLEEASKNPIGTGPYKFVEWSRDNHLKLEAFEDYWLGEPAIKHLEFRYIPEFSSRLSAFLSGEIDMFKNVPVDTVEEIKNAENSKVAEVSSSRRNYVALNTFYDGPMQDEKVRQAINYAVDVDELLDAILNGHGSKIVGVLASIHDGYVETKDYGYDPDKAVELLKEAGYEPEELTLTLETPSGRYPMDSHVAQAIASQLQKIGVTVNVEVNEWGTHLEKIQNREMKDMFILGWGPSFDAQSNIEPLFMKDQPYSSYYEEGLEQKIEEANETFDADERFEKFAEIQHEIVETAAWVPLWQQSDLYAIRENLNFSPRVDEQIYVFEASWE
ncbi:MAG TPA: ABC transporter substrate-binding protein [Bacillota bacterium]|nr:ABC transporter substrate-binding protein [Bacillota bacterium]